MYVNFRDIPLSIRFALTSVGVGGGDVKIEASETFRMAKAYGDHTRATTIVLNLETGARETHMGAFGGANPFGQQARTDIDDTEHTLPVNACAVLSGRSGSATVVIRPDQIARYLPAMPDASPRECDILAVFRGLKSFARPDYLRAGSVTDAEIDALIARKLLTRNKAGATSLTTAGRNASTAGRYERLRRGS